MNQSSRVNSTKQKSEKVKGDGRAPQPCSSFEECQRIRTKKQKETNTLGGSKAGKRQAASRHVTPRATGSKYTAANEHAHAMSPFKTFAFATGYYLYRPATVLDLPLKAQHIDGSID